MFAKEIIPQSHGIELVNFDALDNEMNLFWKDYSKKLILDYKSILGNGFNLDILCSNSTVISLLDEMIIKNDTRYILIPYHISVRSHIESLDFSICLEYFIENYKKIENISKYHFVLFFLLYILSTCTSNKDKYMKYFPFIKKIIYEVQI